VSVIQRKDLITDQAFNWPKEYASQLETLVTKSKQLGQGSARQGATELDKVQKNLARSTERSTKEYIEQKAALDKLNKSNRQAVKDVSSLDSAYDSLSNELNKTRKAYKDLAAAGKGNTKQAKDLKKQVTELDGRLKKIDSSVGQNQRSVGKYSNALQGLGVRFLGVAGAVAGFIGVLRNGLTIIRNYTKANSTLNAVMGVTSKQTKALRLQQKALGETTAFSASEVAKAQTELARLGKTQKEIIDLTPAILDGAVAMGVDLAQAAELVAGQLNAFNLEADQGARVTDTLVKATQISAFNFDRLKTSLAVVSPAANAVGASIEQTVAVLSSAVDANIDASTAATGLRNIYIDLADKGITWDEAMQQINGSTDRLSTANELFGKRGAVVATVIADNTQKINENTIALQNADGAAKAFADETLDNLDGSLTLLKSAWEGFILSLEDGEGVITSVTTGIVDLTTATVNGLSQINKFTGSDSLGFWEKLGVLFGVASGNVASVAASMAQITATNAADEVEQTAEALEKIAEPKVKEAVKEVARSFAKIGEEAKGTDPQGLIDAYVPNTDAIKERLAANEKAVEESLQIISDREEDAKERRRDIINEGVEGAKEIFSNFTDLRIQQIGQEIEAVEFARNRDLQSAGDNERAKAEINKKFDKERALLQRKQANTEKLNSLFSIAINTAQGITKSIAQLGLPAATPFVALTAAIGAAQAAAVLAAPIPQFDEGSDYTPKDYIAGEKSAELRKSKGKWSLVNKPTLFKNSPGDKIVSSKETDSILGTIQDITGNNLLSDSRNILGLLNNDIDHKKQKEDLAYQIISTNKELIRTIKNKKEVSVNVHSRNANVREKSGNLFINRKDYYYQR
jgi:hypothetical protein